MQNCGGSNCTDTDYDDFKKSQKNKNNNFNNLENFSELLIMISPPSDSEDDTSVVTNEFTNTAIKAEFFQKETAAKKDFIENEPKNPVGFSEHLDGRPVTEISSSTLNSTDLLQLNLLDGNQSSLKRNESDDYSPTNLLEDQSSPNNILYNHSSLPFRKSSLKAPDSSATDVPLIQYTDKSLDQFESLLVSFAPETLPQKPIIEPKPLLNLTSPTIDYDCEPSVSDLQSMIQLLQSQIRETTESLISERATVSKNKENEQILSKQVSTLQNEIIKEKEIIFLEKQKYDQLLAKYSKERQEKTLQETTHIETSRSLEIAQEKFKKLEQEALALKKNHEKELEIKKELQTRLETVLHQGDHLKKANILIKGLEQKLAEKLTVIKQIEDKQNDLLTALEKFKAEENQIQLLSEQLQASQCKVVENDEELCELKSEMRQIIKEKASIEEVFNKTVFDYNEEKSSWDLERQDWLSKLNSWTIQQEQLQNNLQVENVKLKEDLQFLRSDLQKLDQIRRNKEEEFSFRWTYVRNVLEKYLSFENQRVTFV